jgi:putative transposase
MERFVRTIKEDCVNRMLFFGEDMLRSTIGEFVIHYHEERNHQALDNQLLTNPAGNDNPRGRLRRRERIGGMLNYYFREAA